MRKAGGGLVLAAALAAATPVPAQSPAAGLARYYFATPAAELKARDDLARQLGDLETYKTSLAKNAGTLAAALGKFEQIQTAAIRHDAYLHLRCSDDSSDTASCDGEDAVDNMVDSRTAFLQSAIAVMPDAKLAVMLKSPALAPYAHAIAEMRRQNGHDAGAAAEEVLAKLSPDLTSWQDDLYELALKHAAFGSVSTPQGPMDVVRQRIALLVYPDRAIRQKAFEQRLAGYDRIRDDAAFALLHTVSAGNAKSLLHKFANAPDAKYFAMGFDPAHTRALIEKVSQSGTLLKRFETIRNADLKRALGIADPAPWDARMPALTVAPHTLDDARAIYHNVFAQLGPLYQGQFDALLDPANERTDIALSAVSNRYSGGFSVGSTGVMSMLFVGNFSGTYKDMSVIAHEGGHAVHRALMDANKVRPIYAEGPHYLFESFAIFNELLLADYLAAHAATPAEKRYYDEQFLDVKGLDYIRGAQDAALEQAFYDGVAAGTLHNADDLDALTLKIDSRFSQWPEKFPELKNRWAALQLAYEDPLYNVNYLYGGLLALQYYKLWKASPQAFAASYVALLQNGFNDTPANLLKRFLKIDLNDEAALVANAQSVDAEKLAALEAKP
ncbi:MAG TPA: M3 family metallopeptidase [Rhizomicrobium sp.]